MRKQKLVSLMLVTAMTASLAAGCGSTSGGEKSGGRRRFR